MSTKIRLVNVVGPVVLLLLAMIVGGCKSLDRWHDAGVDNEFYEEWRERAETSKASSPAAKPRELDLPERQAMLDAKKAEELPEVERPLPTQNISELTMRDTDVAVVLRSLAKIANVNMLISENVEGMVSLELRDVPWNEAFQGILKTQNLRYQWEGDIIRIMTLTDLQQELESDRVEKERKQLQEEARKAEPLIMRTVTLRYADGVALRDALDQVLIRSHIAEIGVEGDAVGAVVASRGSVMLHQATNTLILHAVRDDMVKMIELIETLDRPTPQILIEAHIVEANSRIARELGVEWGGLYKSGNNWITPGSRTNDAILDLPLTPTDGEGIDPVTGPVVDLPVSNLSSGGMTLGYMYYEEGKRMLYAQLQALEEESKLNILSSPSVTTLDNMEAVIESGRDIPYETESELGGSDVEWREAILQLKVTPQVIEDKLIKLAINVMKDELDFDNVITQTSAGANYPLVITKQASTNLILLDGETTVIGGLSKANESLSERGVPYLRNIPILGYLFRNHIRNRDMDELLIFITPHLLPKRSVDEQ